MTQHSSIIEQLSSAKHSHDLSHKPGPCAVDRLGALGAASAKHRQGGAILQMDLSLSLADAHEAEKETRQIVRDVAKRERWTIASMKVAKVARNALMHYLKPPCPACKGRGEIHKANSVVHSCLDCNASGKMPLPERYGREVRAVLHRMEELRFNVTHAVREQLGLRGMALE